MKLYSLELSYFRQHRASEIIFESGLIGIVGPNGAGKTTILEAIIFALFGSRAIRGNVDDLTTRGYKPRQTNVKLRFEHNAILYSLERSINDAKLLKGGDQSPLAVGTRAVSDAIVSLLGMNHEEFTNTYFTEQKGLEFLSGKKGATERARFIIKMLGYDKLERAQELLRKDRSQAKTQLQALQSGMGDLEKVQNTIKQEKLECTNLSSQLSNADLALKSAEEEAKKSSRQRTELDKQRSDYENLLRTQQGLIAEIKIYNEQYADLESKIASKSINLAKQKNVELDRVNIQAHIDKLQNERNNFQQALDSENNKWIQLQSDLKAELSLCDSRKKQLHERLSGIMNLKDNSECPTCGQVLGDFSKKVRFEIAAEIEDVDIRSKDLESLYSEHAHKPAILLELEDKIRQIDIESLSLTEEIQKLKARDQALLELRDIEKQFAGIEEKKAQANISLKDLENKLKSLKFDPAEYSARSQTLEASERLVNVARLQRQKVEAQLEKQQALLQRSELQLGQLKQQLSVIDGLRRDLTLLDESDAAFTALRNQLNASIRPRLSDLASDFILELTDARYSAVEISEDFTATVIEDGIAKPVISGGEQDILNLCVRLALSHMLAERAGSEVGLLVLDEVFGSLDDQRRANVLDLLEKLKNRFEQILVISHLDDVKDGVQHFIDVQYDDGNAVVKTAQFSHDDDLVSNL